MVKIAITCAVLLVLCQLSAARSVDEPTALANSEPNLECAQELAITLREFYGNFIDQARTRFQELSAERERCETLSGTQSVVCWTRYRAQIVFIVSDVIDAFRNRTERFEEYATILLERYFQCRTNDGDVFDVLEEVHDQFQQDLVTITEPLNDIQCATELKDQVVAIYEIFAAALSQRFRAIRTIRRRCQLLTTQPELDRCWNSFRLELLFGVTDTIRDIQARRENFTRVTLELLEAYYECRIE